MPLRARAYLLLLLPSLLLPAAAGLAMPIRAGADWSPSVIWNGDTVSVSVTITEPEAGRQNTANLSWRLGAWGPVYAPVDLTNAAPTIARGSVRIQKGAPGQVMVEGIIDDPTTDDAHDVTATWGDARSQATDRSCELLGDERRQFRCEHTYERPAEPRFLHIRVTARDDHGGRDTYFTTVHVP